MIRLMNTTRVKYFIRLARFDKPIGIYLLFWPTMWALWLAANGIPSIHNLVVFTFGVIFIRGAGCVINDYADRNFDGYVKRTVDRPIASGNITEKEALVYFIALVIPAFFLVLTTNKMTIALSFIAIVLASVYPFAKRYTHLPQVVLGIAFSIAIPMAFAAEKGSLPIEVWLLLFANLAWTIAYDTQYAMVDREDDIKIGIKSTAILFGYRDNLVIALCQILMLIILIIVGLIRTLSWPYYCSLIGAAILFILQQLMTKNRARESCFQAFTNNHWIGMIIFAGIILSLGI